MICMVQKQKRNAKYICDQTKKMKFYKTPITIDH